MDLFVASAVDSYLKYSGPATLDIDKEFRELNFSRTADREANLLDPQLRKIMDAYARGVNLFIEQHRSKLPLEFVLLDYKPEPWKASDSLVIVAYMYRTLTDTRETSCIALKCEGRSGTCQGPVQ